MLCSCCCCCFCSCLFNCAPVAAFCVQWSSKLHARDVSFWCNNCLENRLMGFSNCVLFRQKASAICSSGYLRGFQVFTEILRNLQLSEFLFLSFSLTNSFLLFFYFIYIYCLISFIYLFFFIIYLLKIKIYIIKNYF